MVKIKLCKEELGHILSECRIIEAGASIACPKIDDLIKMYNEINEISNISTISVLVYDCFATNYSFKQRNPDAKSTQFLIEKEGKDWYITDIKRNPIKPYSITKENHL